jgi:hypothetical protein
LRTMVIMLIGNFLNAITPKPPWLDDDQRHRPFFGWALMLPSPARPR